MIIMIIVDENINENEIRIRSNYKMEKRFGQMNAAYVSKRWQSFEIEIENFNVFSMNAKSEERINFPNNISNQQLSRSSDNDGIDVSLLNSAN